MPNYLVMLPFWKYTVKELVVKWNRSSIIILLSAKTPAHRQLLTQRHDAIVRDLKELASEAGVIARDKHLTIFRIADESDGQRPDLLLEKQGTNGRDILLDITVSHPTCSSYVGRAYKERGHTIKKKRKEKNNKYLKKCEDQGACFSPLPFESFG